MLAFARWFFTMIGGVVMGAGLTLHGQVAFVRHLQAQVGGTFFLWRAIGEATFAFQGSDVRMALTASEVPQEALVESDRAAWVLLIVGGLVTLTGPLLRRDTSTLLLPPRRASAPRTGSTVP